MSDIFDLIIVGGGPGGIASAVEAYKQGFNNRERRKPFTNYPKVL